MDGVDQLNELDRWEFDQVTDDNGTLTTNSSYEYINLRQPNTSVQITDEQWSKCNGKTRNLWVTITRIKDSRKKQEVPKVVRELDYYPNGTKFADFDMVFSNYRQSSSASLLKVVSVALAAGLAAFAF